MGKKKKKDPTPPKPSKTSSSTTRQLVNDPTSSTSRQLVNVSSNPEKNNRPSYNKTRDLVSRWTKRLLITFVLISPILLYVTSYRRSLTQVNFTVDRRERVTTGSGDSTNTYYLVWSQEGEVFCVTDSYSFLTFNSSDRYGMLKEGSKVEAHVAGWRIPFFSWYRNVVRIDRVSER